MLVFDHFVKEEIHNNVLESYSIGLGDIAVFIIPHIKFFLFRIKKKKQNVLFQEKFS